MNNIVNLHASNEDVKTEAAFISLLEREMENPANVQPLSPSSFNEMMRLKASIKAAREAEKLEN